MWVNIIVVVRFKNTFSFVQDPSRGNSVIVDKEDNLFLVKLLTI